MKLTLEKQVRDDPALRESFFALARQVFGLSFAPWYQAGGWTPRYQPYALARQGEVVANVSVNWMEFEGPTWRHRLAQLGTVMTHPDWRGRGLARRLLETVIDECAPCCEGIYLFANRTVLEFYPKFGFIPWQERQCVLPLRPAPGRARRLDLGVESDRALLRRLYDRGNPFSAFSMRDNWGLVLFYCGSILADCVFLVEEADAAVIAQQEGERLLCWDVFGGEKFSLPGLLAAVSAPGTKKAALGFAPRPSVPCRGETLDDEDDRLFVLHGRAPFASAALRFPLLSHA